VGDPGETIPQNPAKPRKRWGRGRSLRPADRNSVPHLRC
jgi:hypothetical protein